MKKLKDKPQNIFEDSIQLKKIVTKSVGWLVLKRILGQVIITSTNLILIRILFPEDFGTFAIVYFLMTFIWLIADTGLNKALIQKKGKLDIGLMRTVWWTQALLGLLAAGLIWILSPLMISYYGGHLDPRSITWLRLLGIGRIFYNINLVTIALAERNLHYKVIFIVDTLDVFITQIAVIFLALMGFRVESLVFGFIFGQVVMQALYFMLYPWKWGIEWNWVKLKSLLSISTSEQSSKVLSFISGAVLPVFVGKFPGPGNVSGTEAVGLISWAMGVAILPAFFAEIVEQIFFSLMSRLQTDRAMASLIFSRIFRLVVIVTLVACTLLFVLAADITKIVYTPRWLAALPALRLTIINVFFLAIFRIALMTLLAFGEARYYRNIYLIWTILQWVITIPLVLFFGFWGFNLASILVVLTGFSAFVRLNRYLKISYFNIFFIPTVVCFFIGVAVFSLTKIIAINSLVNLGLVVILAGILYLSLIYLLMKKDLVKDLKMVQEIYSYLRSMRFK